MSQGSNIVDEYSHEIRKCQDKLQPYLLPEHKFDNAIYNRLYEMVERILNDFSEKKLKAFACKMGNIQE